MVKRQFAGDNQTRNAICLRRLTRRASGAAWEATSDGGMTWRSPGCPKAMWYYKHLQAFIFSEKHMMKWYGWSNVMTTWRTEWHSNLNIYCIVWYLMVYACCLHGRLHGDKLNTGIYCRFSVLRSCWNLFDYIYFTGLVYGNIYRKRVIFSSNNWVFPAN